MTFRMIPLLLQVALIETECSVLQVLQVIQALTEHRRNMTDTCARQSPAPCFIHLILQEWAEGECVRKVWYIEKAKSNTCFLFKAGLAHFYYRRSGQECWELTSLRKLLSPTQHPRPSLRCTGVRQPRLQGDWVLLSAARWCSTGSWRTTSIAIPHPCPHPSL